MFRSDLKTTRMRMRTALEISFGNNGHVPIPAVFVMLFLSSVSAVPVNSFVCEEVDICKEVVEFCDHENQRCGRCDDYRQTCNSTLQKKGCEIFCMNMAIAKLTSEIRTKSCENSSILLHGNVSGSNLHGDNQTFSCSKGYSLEGTEKRTCTDYGVWNLPEPTCKEIRCNRLTSPADGFVSQEDVSTVDSIATFSCSPGFNLSGPPALVCTSDGTWNMTEYPMCTQKSKSCANISTIPNGYINGTNQHQANQTFSCEAGYFLKGSKTRTCLDYGIWSDVVPTCTVIQCDKLLPLPNGHVQQEDLPYIGSKATFSCTAGFTLYVPLTVVCGLDGTWNLTQYPECRETGGGNTDDVTIYLLISATAVLLLTIFLLVIVYICHNKRRKVNGNNESDPEPNKSIVQQEEGERRENSSKSEMVC